MIFRVLDLLATVHKAEKIIPNTGYHGIRIENYREITKIMVTAIFDTILIPYHYIWYGSGIVFSIPWCYRTVTNFILYNIIKLNNKVGANILRESYIYLIFL